MVGDSKLLLSDVLMRGGNNFDILRLIAALAVIVGHGYAIAPQPPYQDLIKTLLHFDYSGSLAVKFFFFLSGLLVTDSLIRRANPLLFLIRRVFRIFPGLFVCLLVSVVIVGPVFTKLGFAEYITRSETWNYLIQNTLLVNLQWRLPGVFSDHKYGLNGSLWTLPYEFLCYLYVAIFYGIGLFSSRLIANVTFGAIVVLSFLAPELLPRFSHNPQSFLLPACFAIGALFAINKQFIQINIQNVILLSIFALLINSPAAHKFLFYVAFFYCAVYISSLGFVIRRLKLPFDASYGVYVYGFVIQQSVYGTFPNIGVHGNQLLSSVIALIIGIASWFIIEKPAMNFGAKLTDRYISVFKISSNVLPIRWFLLAASRTSFKKANWASNSILAIPVIIFSIMVTYSVRTAPSSTVVKQSISEKISSYNPKRDGTSYVEATPKMLNWGPRASVVGAVPNKQPDGSMGIWIKVDDTEGLGDAQVVFDGHKIKKTIINKKLITAAIPSWLLDEMGNKEVLIMDISTGKEYQVGMFVSAAKK